MEEKRVMSVGDTAKTFAGENGTIRTDWEASQMVVDALGESDPKVELRACVDSFLDEVDYYYTQVEREHGIPDFAQVALNIELLIDRGMFKKKKIPVWFIVNREYVSPGFYNQTIQIWHHSEANYDQQ